MIEGMVRLELHSSHVIERRSYEPTENCYHSLDKFISSASKVTCSLAF